MGARTVNGDSVGSTIGYDEGNGPLNLETPKWRNWITSRNLRDSI
jgi:hypothetical protein